jgi:hypothetical protein
VNISTLIGELKRQPADAPVFIELVGMPLADDLVTPVGLDSYRGYYEELAIEYSAATANLLTAGEFVTDLESAIGNTYEGYKGGSFTMTERTPLWCANYGESGGWAPAEVVERDDRVIVRAFKFERW